MIPSPATVAPPSLRARLFFVFWLIVAAGLQTTFASRIPTHWGEPDVPLTLCLVAGLLSDAVAGGVCGLLAGLVTASLVGQTVGSFLVGRALAGYVAGWSTSRLYRGNVFVVVPGVFLLSIFSEGVYLLAAPRIGLARGPLPLLFAAIGNAVLSLPILFVLRRSGWGDKR